MRFIKIINVLVLALVVNIAKSQTSNEELKLKEFFDHKKSRVGTIYEGYDYGTYKDSTYFSNVTGCDDMAEVIAPIMDSELILYETTNDKGYLVNFINDAVQMISIPQLFRNKTN